VGGSLYKCRAYRRRGILFKYVFAHNIVIRQETRERRSGGAGSRGFAGAEGGSTTSAWAAVESENEVVKRIYVAASLKFEMIFSMCSRFEYRISR
jgi:hypothetical protein